MRGRSGAGFGLGLGSARATGATGFGWAGLRGRRFELKLGSGLRSGRRTGSGCLGFASSTHSGTCSTVCSRRLGRARGGLGRERGLVGAALLLRLALGGLGRPKQLGQRAFTHARAPARH